MSVVWPINDDMSDVDIWDTLCALAEAVESPFSLLTFYGSDGRTRLSEPDLNVWVETDDGLHDFYRRSLESELRHQLDDGLEFDQQADLIRALLGAYEQWRTSAGS